MSVAVLLGATAVMRPTVPTAGALIMANNMNWRIRSVRQALLLVDAGIIAWELHDKHELAQR